MAAFGAYLLPLWYEKGARAEHLAVLSTAGLFDTSYMPLLLLEGPASLELLQHFYSRDLCRWGKNRDKTLPVGRGVYGVFLDRQGCLLDDSLIYRVAENSYFICLNAGKATLLENHLGAFQGDFTLANLDRCLTKMDLQGPNSARILARVLAESEEVFAAFPFFSCQGTLTPYFTTERHVATKTGIPLLLARSGYTGEFGFEIFAAAGQAEVLWEEIFQAGQEFGLLPCGLAARDSLRAGAGLPLAGHDIGNWPFVNNPWLFALPFEPDGKSFSKDFLGAQALLRAEPSYTYAFAGYDPRKLDPETEAVLNAKGERIGEVLTCVTDMAIDRVEAELVSINSKNLPPDYTPGGLSCGFVKTSAPFAYGEKIALQDKRRSIEVEIVRTIRPDCSARLPLQQFL
jgi:aminomethyltransferase